MPTLFLLLQTPQLVSLLQQCCSGERADLQLNVVSALGQLARDQQVTAAAVMEPTGAFHGTAGGVAGPSKTAAT
jgi:hypothetical protein